MAHSPCSATACRFKCKRAKGQTRQLTKCFLRARISVATMAEAWQKWAPECTRAVGVFREP
eukprot:10963039-Alexandrium_andersonii.AAC.1